MTDPRIEAATISVEHVQRRLHKLATDDGYTAVHWTLKRSARRLSEMLASVMPGLRELADDPALLAADRVTQAPEPGNAAEALHTIARVSNSLTMSLSEWSRDAAVELRNAYNVLAPFFQEPAEGETPGLSTLRETHAAAHQELTWVAEALERWADARGRDELRQAATAVRGASELMKDPNAPHFPSAKVLMSDEDVDAWLDEAPHVKIRRESAKRDAEIRETIRLREARGPVFTTPQHVIEALDTLASSQHVPPFARRVLLDVLPHLTADERDEEAARAAVDPDAHYEETIREAERERIAQLLDDEASLDVVSQQSKHVTLTQAARLVCKSGATD